eukprot:scaffold73355_cov28-Tisochrysis_lutea.AAC.1
MSCACAARNSSGLSEVRQRAVAEGAMFALAAALPLLSSLSGASSRSLATGTGKCSSPRSFVAAALIVPCVGTGGEGRRGEGISEIAGSCKRAFDKSRAPTLATPRRALLRAEATGSSAATRYEALATVSVGGHAKMD